jgi:TPR repeat protein
VADLFSELIISEDFQDWQVLVTHEFAEWPRTGLRADRLAEINRNGTYLLAHSLTEKPVKLTQDNSSFFDNRDLESKRDGSWMGFKYVFVPFSLFSSKEVTDPGNPLFFYLIKKIPNDFNANELTEALREDQVKEIVDHYSASYDNYNSALFYKNNGNKELADVHLFKSANLGNAQAQYDYARELGQCVESCTKPVARKYYKKAANQGHADAQNDYAWMLQEGQGGKVDLFSAREYYKKAAGQEHARGQNNYAWMLQHGLGGIVDLHSALEYYKKAADQGNADGQRNYTWLLSRIQVVDPLAQIKAEYSFFEGDQEKEAKRKLLTSAHGTYYLRPSRQQSDCFVVHVLKDHVYNLKIQVKEDGLYTYFDRTLTMEKFNGNFSDYLKQNGATHKLEM